MGGDTTYLGAFVVAGGAVGGGMYIEMIVESWNGNT